VTSPRIAVSGATTALVRRTTMRKAFLAPWDPMVEQMWLYSLADAQRETGVEVHFSGLFITHHHSDVTPTRSNLPEFTRRFHRDMSCGLHTLLCARKYDAPRELFDDRPTHWTRLLDAEAQASRLVYDAVNGVAAGLVARPQDMPMRFLDFGLWKTGYILVERPPLYFGDDRPERQKLFVTPPPLLYRAFGGDMDALVFHMRRLVDDAARRLRAEHQRPVLGAKQIRRIHPWDEPRTMRESGPSPHRTFRVGAGDILGKERRIAGAVEVRDFRHGHETTRVARKGGDLDARYPYGTYAAHVIRNEPVADVLSDAFVTAPGPTLADVQAELAARRVDRDEVRAGAHAVSEAVRDAFENEAAGIAADAELELATKVARPVARASGDDTAAEAADEDDRDPVVVRHRFDRRRGETARRIITLRDKRRGRPPGSDPPAD
jgi:hypothetical protein